MEVTNYLRRPPASTGTWSSQGPAMPHFGGMADEAHGQSGMWGSPAAPYQPGGLSAAVRAMQQGSPFAGDMLRVNAGLPTQLSRWSSGGQQQPPAMPHFGGMWNEGQGQMGYAPGGAPPQRPMFMGQPPLYAGGPAQAFMGPQFQPAAFGPMPNWPGAMSGQGAGYGMGGPQMPAAMSGPASSPPDFNSFAQQQPYPSGKGTPYGPFMNAQSPASLFRQQQMLAQFYGMQPRF